MSGGGYYITRHVGPWMRPHLDRFLGAPLRYQPVGRPGPGALGLVGWGLKGVFAASAAYAQRIGMTYVAVEDGFLRSIEPGDGATVLSLSVDPVGVYYDARRPSRLEQLVARGVDAAQQARAQALARQWCAARVSKYNHARELLPPVPGPFVLVVDQTFGDASIAYGLADAASFTRMLEAALDEHPALPVVLKVHPDVIAGRKRAHFGALSPGQAARVTLLASDSHPPALLEAAQAVYVVTSQMGFEALLWGKPVRCFGMPFYAGWGLTDDLLPAPARRGPASLPALVHAALIEHPRYLDPETLERCEPERAIDWMALQRRQRVRFPAQVQAVAFSEWKKPIARAFLAGSTLQFVDTPQPLGAAGARAVWGRPKDGDPVADTGGAPLLRVEDGFLRSVGLGANWVQPLSWVVDAVGMYYDATRPSALEQLLEGGGFEPALLERARLLRTAIVASGVTKYNVGAGAWQRPASGKPVVLVPGQVENDASIAYGAPGLRRNLELLRAARGRRPDAHLVYKPHPDVLAGKRPGDAHADEARRWCDEIVTDVPMHRLLESVDELQVLTSLAGFEALLRGKPVVCHGQPFYAGWGLTEDVLPHPRRTRRASLDELVAAALILYPTYVSRRSGAFTTPERVLHELAHWAETAPPPERPVLRALRQVKRWRDRLRRR